MYIKPEMHFGVYDILSRNVREYFIIGKKNHPAYNSNNYAQNIVGKIQHSI